MEQKKVTTCEVCYPCRTNSIVLPLVIIVLVWWNMTTLWMKIGVTLLASSILIKELWKLAKEKIKQRNLQNR